MILYFSGTGNSRYTAQLIGAVTGDKIVSINNLLKSGSTQLLQSDRPFVVVCPTYGWRIPRVVDKFIKQASFEGSDIVYFVLTCGGEPGNAERYAKMTAKDKGFRFFGLASVVMPENYIALFSVPDKAQAEAIIIKAVPRIRDIAGYIKAGQPLPREGLTLIDRLKSSIVNDVFYMAFVKARGFYTTERCNGCGRCAKLCPLNNITLVQGKPVWGQHCTHCMGCICGCPCEAIEYKRNSQGQPRYFLTKRP